MTRKKFKRLESKYGFDYAMDELSCERDDITTYDNLK